MAFDTRTLQPEDVQTYKSGLGNQIQGAEREDSTAPVSRLQRLMRQIGELTESLDAQRLEGGRRLAFVLRPVGPEGPGKEQGAPVAVGAGLIVALELHLQNLQALGVEYRKLYERLEL